MDSSWLKASPRRSDTMRGAGRRNGSVRFLRRRTVSHGDLKKAIARSSDFQQIAGSGEADIATHHLPVLGMDAQGSFLGCASPFCSSSIDTLSGERMNAMRPSRGGRLMVTLAFISRSHKA
jgi:hypothetical protein